MLTPHALFKQHFCTHVLLCSMPEACLHLMDTPPDLLLYVCLIGMHPIEGSAAQQDSSCCHLDPVGVSAECIKTEVSS